MSADAAASAAAGPDDAARVDAAIARLADAVAEVGRLDVQAIDTPHLKQVLEQAQRQLDRLTAARTRLVGIVGARARAAAPPGKQQRAERQTQDDLRQQLRLRPGEAKQAAEVGRSMSEPSPASDAFAAGDLRQEHAAIIADVCGTLDGHDREELERELVEAAARLDPTALGRLARRRVLELDVDQARGREERQHARRRMSMTTTDDGGVHISGMLYGLQGEKALTAFHAFRTPDTTDQRRLPQQRGADAFEALADAALAAGQAPSQHGVRPHVTVQIPWSVLEAGEGTVELGYLGPVSFAEVRSALHDASVCRLVLDAKGVPIEVSEQVRTVPAGLWRALVARDGGCSWAGCDTPPAWCQVAHGQEPFRSQGRLKLGNAALLCSRHHRQFDAGGWNIVIDGPAVTYERRGRAAAADAAEARVAGPGGDVADMADPGSVVTDVAGADVVDPDVADPDVGVPSGAADDVAGPGGAAADVADPGAAVADAAGAGAAGDPAGPHRAAGTPSGGEDLQLFQPPSPGERAPPG